MRGGEARFSKISNWSGDGGGAQAEVGTGMGEGEIETYVPQHYQKNGNDDDVEVNKPKKRTRKYPLRQRKKDDVDGDEIDDFSLDVPSPVHVPFLFLPSLVLYNLDLSNPSRVLSQD